MSRVIRRAAVTAAPEVTRGMEKTISSTLTRIRSAKHQVIAALVCHGADAAHALAQKGQIQRNKPLRYDHGNIVGAQFFAALCRNRLGAGTPHIGVHLGAGLLADASLAGKCTRYRCFRKAKRISHLLDCHFFGFLCSHRISSPFHRTAQQCATPAYRGKPALSSMKANKKRSAFSAERSKGKLLQDLFAVFPDGRSVTVQRNTSYFDRMFIAVLYKDERTAPRGQNAVRQCLRPGRVRPTSFTAAR